jgi:hypothetical protein
MFLPPIPPPQGGRVRVEVSFILCLFVIDPGFSVQFCFELLQFVYDDVFRNFAIRIVKVSKHPDSCHTSRHTGRLFTFLNELDAKPAFLNIALFLDNSDIVGAGSNTIFTADAFILVHQGHAILSLIRGPGRAYLHTWRVVTMLTLNGQELAGIIWESPIFALFQMIICLLLIEIVLIMAGYSTGMTSNTFCFINDHSVPRHCFLSHLSFISPSPFPSPLGGEGWGEGQTLNFELFYALLT